MKEVLFMKLITALLTGALVVGGLGTNSYAMSNNQETTIKNNTSVQTDLAEQPIRSVKAIEIAVNTTKGGLISNIYLDDEHGKEVYKIKVIHQDTEYDVNVDASTGKVIKVKQADHLHNDDKFQDKSPKISLDEAKK